MALPIFATTNVCLICFQATTARCFPLRKQVYSSTNNNNQFLNENSGISLSLISRATAYSPVQFWAPERSMPELVSSVEKMLNIVGKHCLPDVYTFQGLGCLPINSSAFLGDIPETRHGTSGKPDKQTAAEQTTPGFSETSFRFRPTLPAVSGNRRTIF